MMQSRRVVSGSATTASDTRTTAFKALDSTARGARSASHVVAVDGLRALAIIGVIAYHARPTLLGGGFLGVTLFFVVSGFFITRGMMARLAKHSFRYGTYLRKRTRRLWPAILATIALTALLVYLCSPFLLPKESADALPSALFCSNWWFIVRKQSYFAAAGLPSPLTHLWYTSLIMQFYVVWPWVLLLVVRRFRSRWLRIGAVAALAACSTLEMVVLHAAHADMSRLYYGLDTRAAELLAGALLALLLEDGKVRHWHGNMPDRASRVLDAVSCALMALMLVLFIVVDDQSSWLYYGGFTVVALLSAVLLAACLRPGLLSRMLSCRPLRYLGSRSFSLYLVHYPLLEVMNPATRLTPPSWWQWIAQFIVIALVGEVFYQCIEALRGTPLLPWSPARAGTAKGGQRPGAVIMTVVGVLVTIAMAVAPSWWATISKQRSIALRPELSQQVPATTPASPQTRQPQESTPATPAKATPQALKVPSNLDPSQYDCDWNTRVCHAKLLIIGDSVMKGAAPYVQQHFPDALIDAEVSRHFWAFLERYPADIANYKPQAVFIALNVNGPLSQELADQIYAMVGPDVPIYMMTGRAPVDWVDGTNEFIKQFAAQHPNVGIIDWAGLTGEHPEYLGEDGTHPIPVGAEAFANLIFDAMCGQRPQ